MPAEAQICAIGILAIRRNAQQSAGPHRQKLLEIRSITLFLCALVPEIPPRNPCNPWLKFVPIRVNSWLNKSVVALSAFVPLWL